MHKLRIFNTEYCKCINKDYLGSIFTVAFSNFCLLAAKMVVWLFVPKLLGVEGYGYYKLFMMYMAYTALLHFGIPDGILLLFGGKRYEELNKDQFRSITVIFLFIEFFVSIFISVTTTLFAERDLKFIFIILSFDSFFVNITTYFRFISQATMRFKEYSLRNIIQATLQIITVALLYLISISTNIVISGKDYILCIVLIDALLFLWYLITYRELIFGKYYEFSNIKEIILNIIKAGILLTISYEISHLIFILDSQMVSWLYDLKTYALYAFSYSVVSFITQTINAISTVIFPNLKRMGKQQAFMQYDKIIGGVIAIVFVMATVYYPVRWIVGLYLSDYAEMDRYLRIIIPGIALSCCINMIIFTYYKVINNLKVFLNQSLRMLVFALGLNIVCYFATRKAESFSIASIITLLIWFFYSQYYLVKEYNVKWKKNALFLIGEIVAFYTIVYWIPNILHAFIIYFLIATIMAIYMFLHLQEKTPNE